MTAEKNLPETAVTQDRGPNATDEPSRPVALDTLRNSHQPPFSQAGRDLKEVSAMNPFRDLQDSPTMAVFRDFENSPTMRVLRDLENSPTMRVLRDLENSPTMRALRDLENSPTTRALRDLENSPTMRALRDLENSPTTRALRDLENSPTMRALRDLENSPTTRALRDLENSPTMRALRDLENSPGMAAMARTTQWASQFASFDTLAGIMPSSEFLRVQQAASGVLSLSTDLDRLRLTAGLGIGSLSAELETTRMKLSALAGTGEVLGFAARSSWAAYEQLFGQWRTRPDLPDRFWRDPMLRQQEYREADVDPGLIETTPAAAIEVVIQSGFAAGASSGEASVALLDVAGLSVTVRSSNPEDDAYRAIRVFERALRTLISAKLTAAAGPKWFRQRVDGTARQKALDLRAAAMANGERDSEPLSYLDLGDLIPILLRKDNWDGTFGHVFPNRERLRIDLEALVVSRRPTMHSREVDAVRLVELICIISRLSQWIVDDGDWKRIAESED